MLSSSGLQRGHRPDPALLQHAQGSDQPCRALLKTDYHPGHTARGSAPPCQHQEDRFKSPGEPGLPAEHRGVNRKTLLTPSPYSLESVFTSTQLSLPKRQLFEMLLVGTKSRIHGYPSTHSEGLDSLPQQLPWKGNPMSSRGLAPSCRSPATYELSAGRRAHAGRAGGAAAGLYGALQHALSSSTRWRADTGDTGECDMDYGHWSCSLLLQATGQPFQGKLRRESYTGRHGVSTQDMQWGLHLTRCPQWLEANAHMLGQG